MLTSSPPSNATCLKVINYNHHLIITVIIKKYETTTTERLIIVWTQQTVGSLFNYYTLRFMHFYKTLWNSLQRCCFNCVTVFLSLPYNIALCSRSCAGEGEKKELVCSNKYPYMDLLEAERAYCCIGTVAIVQLFRMIKQKSY